MVGTSSPFFISRDMSMMTAVSSESIPSKLNMKSPHPQKAPQWKPHMHRFPSEAHLWKQRERFLPDAFFCCHDVHLAFFHGHLVFDHS